MNANTKINGAVLYSAPKIRLSIVDQNKLMRSVYKYALSQHKNIESIKLFDSAKDYIRNSSQTDVVILELKSKQKNDLEAIKLIKEHFPEIKIIITTPFEDESTALKILSLGVNAYVTKEVDFEELYNIIHTVFKGSMWIDFKIAKTAMAVFQKQMDKQNKSELFLKLTDREKEVLKYITEGLTNNRIARILNISSHTVKAHVSSIISKLSVEDRVQAAVAASKYSFV